MQALDRTAAQTLRAILSTQPASLAKATFAWRMAAGPTMAAAAQVVSCVDGRLCLLARTEAWHRELTRGHVAILQRLRDLLGAEAVRRLEILPPE